MKNYTDYIFYSDKYMGTMPKDNFEKIITRASTEVRKKIFDRNITGYEEEVQTATCSVADILYKIEQIEQKISKLISCEKADKIIASEQVANVSRTFATATNIKDLEQEISNQETKIKQEIELYLLHTGLMYRGV